MGTNEIYRQIITILRNHPRGHYLNCIYIILQQQLNFQSSSSSKGVMSINETLHEYKTTLRPILKCISPVLCLSPKKIIQQKQMLYAVESNVVTALYTAIASNLQLLPSIMLDHSHCTVTFRQVECFSHSLKLGKSL